MTRDKSQNIRGLGAERHAHPDFLGALTNGICHHAIQSDGGKKKGQAREDGKECSEKPPFPERFHHHLIHGFHFVDRNFLIHRQHRRAREIGKRRGISFCPQHYRHEPVRVLILRDVNTGELAPLGQPIVNHVAHDSDNGGPFQRFAEFFKKGHLMANRIDIRKPFVGGCVVDQDDTLAVFVVGNGKIPPAQKRNVRGGKITGRDGEAMRHSRVLQLLRLRFTLENERAHSDVSRRWKRRSRGGRFHSGNASDLWHQRGEESAGVLLFELGGRQTNSERQSVRWIDSNIGPLKFYKTAQHQSGAYQQDQGKGYFGDDQTITHTLAFATANSAATSFLDRIDQLRARRLQRWK